MAIQMKLFHICSSIDIYLFLAGSLAYTSQGTARANDCLFDGTMTDYIAARFHSLEAVLLIHYLGDCNKYK